MPELCDFSRERSGRRARRWWGAPDPGGRAWREEARRSLVAFARAASGERLDAFLVPTGSRATDLAGLHAAAADLLAQLVDAETGPTPSADLVGVSGVSLRVAVLSPLVGAGHPGFAEEDLVVLTPASDQ